MNIEIFIYLSFIGFSVFSDHWFCIIVRSPFFEYKIIDL